MIAYFADTLEQLNAIAAEYQGDTPVMATLAERLSIDIAAHLNLDETAIIDLIVAERHPLLTVDDKLLHFAEELPCRCRLAHHLSLEDPEAIESSMVSRRVKEAQKKIQAQALGNAEAGSAAEWVEQNMPQTVKI